jgi:saccharopine dehydrogenase-like NADP-dependent oxidoreductase
MKKILLFGAGKSATSLIDYLSLQCGRNGWNMIIADRDVRVLREKIAGQTPVEAIALGVEDETGRGALIQQADLVISLLPASLHYLIAKDCIQYNRNLLTASYLDDQIRSLSPEINGRQLFFLGEMGLDPGIDHMSAMQIIDRIHAENGRILSFRSHTGGLVAPESDDNPWHYKISWNPRNIVRAGSAGAVFRDKGMVLKKDYAELFENAGTVSIPGAGPFAFYPNRNSLDYQSVYGLEETDTFMRTTLRHPAFCEGWKYFVASGLTDDRLAPPADQKTIRDWAAALLARVPSAQRPLFEFLGLSSASPLPRPAKTNADILQSILEEKWQMQPQDKDMIIMFHEFAYEVGGEKHSLQSSLMVKGTDHVHTAMAKTVGLPLAIAATLALKGEIKLTGLHIPTIPEIYTPVLNALKQEGIQFEESFS